jgi:UDP-N-acetylglucosamine 2-epimerase (non-hydrolysing)
MKILSVVGARPNLVKIAPLLREMQKHREIQPVLVHTGQHYDERLSDLFFRQMGIRLPDVNLGVGSGSHASQTADVLRGMETVLKEHQPDVLVVVGDVNSTLAASLAAAKLGIRIAHVEAGLRSYDRRMPEEINRVLTDAISDLLFVTERDAIENLLREGRSRDQIHFVGNVMIDALTQYLPLARQSRVGEDLGLVVNGEWRPYALLTLHRPSNVDDPERLRELLETIEKIAATLPVVFPVHPRTRQRMLDAGINEHPGVILVPPLGYLEFICLLSWAKIVLTDSGGIQEETTALGVPCLTLRENTERPVTIREGTNQLVGLEPTRIFAAAKEIMNSTTVSTRRIPQYWDGHAAERIINILLGRTVVSTTGQESM